MKRPRLRLAVGGGLAVCLLLALAASRLGLDFASSWTRSVVDHARDAGPVGWALLVLAQAAIALVGIIPASLLGIAAGALYGIAGGIVLASIGTVLGGWAAFAIARSLLRPSVERMLARRLGSRLVQLDAAVAQDGWRFVCLMRISPIMPFAVTSYALGLTEISPRDYLLGTLASLPALAGYVTLGSLARTGVASAADGWEAGALHWALLGAGIVATAVLTLRSGTLLARSGLLGPRQRQV